MTNPKFFATDNTPAGALWVERVGAREYVGHNDRGGKITFTDAGVPNTFTPGEVTKLAAAACSGLVTDRTLARRAGDDYEAQIQVTSVLNKDENRYESIAETLVVDLNALDAEARDRLVALVQSTIASQCTIGRTIEAGAQVTIEVVSN